MDDSSGAFALDLINWTKKERRVKVAGRRFPPRYAARQIEKKMNASLKGGY